MNRLAIFDCDGTLVDSGATIHAALSETFRQNGLAVPPLEASRRVIGLSLVEAMAALLEGWGCDVATTRSTADALERLRELGGAPDAIGCRGVAR